MIIQDSRPVTLNIIVDLHWIPLIHFGLRLWPWPRTKNFGWRSRSSSLMCIIRLIGIRLASIVCQWCCHEASCGHLVVNDHYLVGNYFGHKDWAMRKISWTSSAKASCPSWREMRCLLSFLIVWLPSVQTWFHSGWRLLARELPTS